MVRTARNVVHKERNVVHTEWDPECLKNNLKRKHAKRRTTDEDAGPCCEEMRTRALTAAEF